MGTRRVGVTWTSDKFVYGQVLTDDVEICEYYRRILNENATGIRVTNEQILKVVDDIPVVSNKDSSAAGAIWTAEVHRTKQLEKISNDMAQAAINKNRLKIVTGWDYKGAMYIDVYKNGQIVNGFVDVESVEYQTVTKGQ